ncbi:PRC-barrel domain-containing protein [Kiritimatiellaeota bacterium B1221]|nr:PRC-barrel domain-containing protein [Kiritimatiellaeota bacterium B1221]
MQTSLESLRGFTLKAKNGEIGRVRDLLLEEGSWTVRWIVVDTGKWLLGRKVLLSPLAFGAADFEEKNLPVDLDREQIEGAPHLDEHAPVSREYEKTYYDHYQWPYYWMGGGIWGSAAHPIGLHTLNADRNINLKEPPLPEEKDVVLRSGHELTKYELKAGDETLGYVDDILLDTKDWTVRAIQFDTRKWFQGKILRLSPTKISRVSWQEHRIVIDSESIDKSDLNQIP